MYCRYCGKELPDNSNFCPNCGRKQGEYPNSALKLNAIRVLKQHRYICYVYICWLLIHLSLYIFSDQHSGYYDRRNHWHNVSENYFYPFGCELNNVFTDFPYVNFSLFKYCDAYDLSELFFYTILLPIIIWGVIRLWSSLKPFWTKLNNHYHPWKEDTKKRKENQTWKEGLQKSRLDVSSSEIVTEKATSPSPNTESVQQDDEAERQSSNVDIPSEISIHFSEAEEQATIEEPKKFPLFRRIVGTIIDKILILVIFVVGSFILSYYGAPGKLGTYIGLRNASPEIYEWIDKAAMDRYGSYSEDISHFYQDMERLETEPPHMGSTMELDMSITFSFILFNLIYYILFESIMSASPGKWVLEGVLLDSVDEKIDFGKALMRGLCGGALMAGTYYIFHLVGMLSNTVVVVIFFLAMDLPVLFTKRSLLDICTGTTYILKKETIKKSQYI